MPLRKSVRKYFVFSKKERNVALLLSVLISLAALLPVLLPKNLNHPPNINSDSLVVWFTAVPVTDTGQFTNASQNRYPYPKNYFSQQYASDFQPREKSVLSHWAAPHFFDPDTVSAQQWKEMGLADPVINRIMHYREKGGRFNNAAALLKVYGFDSVLYTAISPWIKKDSIPEKNYAAENNLVRAWRTDTIIEINAATRRDLVSIGFTIAEADQILSFRESAGGISSTQQLLSIYHIDQKTLLTVLPYIQCNAAAVKKININTASFEQLSKHAYISDDLAHAIIAYRESTGRFTSLSELMKIKGMYASLFEKLKPYLMI